VPEEAKTADQPKKAAAAKPAAGGDKHCRIARCKRPYRAKGYCNVHYREWRHGKHPKRRYKICTKEACRKPRAKGSLCAEHAGTAPAAAAG
jgi:hypothetical protein